MKKLVLTCLAAALLPVASFAQGTLTFSSSSAAQSILLPDGTTGAPIGTLAYLWWSPTQGGAYSIIGTNSITAAPGYITSPITATTGLATPEGANAWFYVSAVSGTMFGQTPEFQNPTGGNDITPTPVPPANLTGWTDSIVLAVPEPTTFALAGLGAAALMIFRRRRQ